MSETRSYNSRLRQEQAEATSERILAAMAAILEEDGSLEAATNRAVAERAGVREITVYRHFPNREALLRGLWAWMNRRTGVTVGMPEREADLAGKLPALYATFDAQPARIVASLTTPSGRKMRESLDPERREAFLAAVEDAAGHLPERERVKLAAMMQLIYSAYGWISMREQWGLDGKTAADAGAWAIETLLKAARERPAEPQDTKSKAKSLQGADQ